MMRGAMTGVFLLLTVGCGSDEDGERQSNGGSAGSMQGGSSGTGGSNGGSGGSNGGSTQGGSGGTAGADPRPPLPCFGDEGMPAGSAINLELLPSRTSGVAPLAVFFDSSATTADATDLPFHELAFCWDFDDPDSGNFDTTGLSKNQAKGAVTGHIFEEPGTYMVAVTARDANGLVAGGQVEITVSDPEEVYAGANTVCFSPGGDFAGCPEGAEQVTSSELSALQDHVDTNRRLLLQRGARFTFSESIRINVAGPGTVGAYGTGDKPVMAVDAQLFNISGEEPRFADWRLMDFEVEGSGEAQIVNAGGRIENLTVLRVTSTGHGTGVATSLTVMDYYYRQGNTVHDGAHVVAVQDCEFSDDGDGYNLYVAAHGLIMLGNRIRNATQNSMNRFPWLDGAVISNNALAIAPAESHLLYIHGPSYTEAPEGPSPGNGHYSERIIISDNVIDPGDGPDWTVYMGPQNVSSDERLRDIVFERNFLLGGEQLNSGVMMAVVTNATLRDNVLHNGGTSQCFGARRSGSQDLPSENIRLIHNTCVSGASAEPLFFQFAESDAATGVVVLNNLIVGASGTLSNQESLLEGPAGNLLVDSAGFTSDAAATWEDFTLEASSPAVDAADPAFWSAWDLSGQPRFSGAAPDCGALEYVP